MAGNKISLIMDVDWAHDDVVMHALDIVAKHDVPVTVFVTHDSSILAEMRSRPNVEIGVHPNFNDLLDGTAEPGSNAKQRVAYLRELVPEAKSIRSHSLCQNSRVLDLFEEFDFSFEVNTLIPLHVGLELKAWRHWSGKMLRVPAVFEDSVASLLPDGWDVGSMLKHPGLRVLNFHPVRLFLNAFESSMSGPKNLATLKPDDLKQFARGPESMGSRTYLEQLISSHKDGGGTFECIKDIVL